VKQTREKGPRKRPFSISSLDPSSAPRKLRLARLRAKLADQRADAIFVSSLHNVSYLCGFTGSAAALVVDEASATLFTDSRYTFQAAEEVRGARVRITKKGLLAEAGAYLRSRRAIRRIAYSEAQLAVAQHHALRKAAGAGVRWVDDGNAVEFLRIVKDVGEIAIMADAATLIDSVVRAVYKQIKPGISELDIAAEIDYQMRRKGAAGPSFETIVASGERSAWPHARPTNRRLGKNELVLLDQGAILRGYCSDITRTVFLGESPQRVRRLYHAVWEAQQAAKGAIRPGATAGDVDQAARRALERAKLGPYFMHSTGHGLGLEVHEGPRVGKGSTAVLQEGMVITVEPGIYLEGFGGIRIEDDVVVTRNGYRDLTTAPRELLEL